MWKFSMQKLCLSTKFPQREIWWNCDMFSSKIHLWNAAVLIWFKSGICIFAPLDGFHKTFNFDKVLPGFWCFLTNYKTQWAFNIQKQPSRGVLRERCSENMQQNYRWTSMPKCNFDKVALQLYWNRTSAWVFSCKFAAYF